MSGDVNDLLAVFTAKRCRSVKTLARRTGCAAEVQDLTRAAWLRFAANAAAARRNPVAYLRRIVAKLGADRSRARRRRTDFARDAGAALSATAPDPEAAAIHRDDLRRLAQAVAAMPPRRRDMLLAARLRGAPYRAIAARHGVSNRAVEAEIRAVLRATGPIHQSSHTPSPGRGKAPIRLSGAVVHRPHRLDYDGHTGVYAYIALTDRDAGPLYPASTVWCDARTAEPLGAEFPIGDGAGRTVTHWLQVLHYGAALGPVWRATTAVVGVAALTVTSLLVWLRQRRVRRRAAPELRVYRAGAVVERFSKE
ncbi:sigma factor-like helix-turn-helix DNA-binding protein [Rubrimonas cliftonensis]|uniref:RNA polymerase sigma factor, sigma-70 family n=1 Tax=Rubrimonas cliftonensis TaxID=89524 RepID=A0A1H4F0I3_9RHOB|nr:sigma factor-like helix-turn-helix DNA-binding protein [Rubrimonas cliftonensis]SEA90507.1 RNA polymerase sigma factor, sigma-70 family [Rubrimonas cliftonensis]